MCGIGGILRRVPAMENEAAQNLLRGLSHRGPDDCGIWNSHDRRVSLVHARLAILDRSKAGHQPMERAGNCLTFNGEIYNFRALRDELEKGGARFISATDTELLLELYRRDGPKCLSRLRGMFALALWDERRQTCFLARDHFGIKPLYYSFSSNGDLIFGSELKALLATGVLEREIDPAGLESFLASGSVAEPLTMLAGVHCLEAGHWMSWKDGVLEEHRYFELNFQVEKSPCEAQELAHAALLDSVRHHFVSDVPVGIFLSGGLDSGALVALARETGHHDLATFSIGVENSSQDESNAARSRAKSFGTDHREMLLTAELAGQWVDPFLDAIDQPTVDGFNTYCAAKLAADHGFRVALSGLGGDELFGSYPSFRQIPALLKVGRAAGCLGPLVRPLAQAWERRTGFGRTARLAGFLSGDATLPRAYQTVRSIFSPSECREIIRAVTGADHRAPSVASGDTEFGGEVPDEISRLELTRYLRNQLLRDADVMSMAHGLELRVPFIDHELFAVLRTIPSALRLDPEKQLLRASVPGLRAEEQPTRKQGFAFPFEFWLDGTWTDLKDELRGAPKMPLDTWSRKWCLIVLSRWLRRHGFQGWAR